MYKSFSSSFDKGNLDKSCKPFSNTISTDFDMYSHGSYFHFPCRITSCVCGRKIKRRNSKESKKSKKISAFSETNVKNSASSSCKCTENLNKTPINIQLLMSSADNSCSPLTFVVDVPSTILEIFQKRNSDINVSKSFTVLKRARSQRPKTRKIRSLKSVFRKLLSNKTAESCSNTSTSKSSSFVKSDSFSSDMKIRENGNSHNSFPILSDFSHINITHRTSDVLHTDFCTSDVENNSTDNLFERQCHINQTKNKMRDEKRKKLILDELYINFLETELNKEWDRKHKIEKENGFCTRCKQNAESLIDVKFRKSQLWLKRSHHGNQAKTELQDEFLKKFIKTLPKEPSDKCSVDNERKCGSKATFLTDDKGSSVIKTSTLEYLLQNLADVEKKEDINLKQSAEKDWHQTLSTRQLSKISLCSSGNCTCSVKDEYESGVIEINEEDRNEKSDIKLSITARLHRLTFNFFGR